MAGNTQNGPTMCCFLMKLYGCMVNLVISSPNCSMEFFHHSLYDILLKKVMLNCRGSFSVQLCTFRITNIFIQLLVTKIHAINAPGWKFKLSLGPWEFRGNKICVSSPDSWGVGADSLIPSWCLVPRSLQSCQMIAAIWTPTADMLLPWGMETISQRVYELIIQIL